MSRCFQCATKFGLFKKEHDCKNCGRILCKSCLSYKTKIPKFGSNEVHVCSGCYKSLTKNVEPIEMPPSYQEVAKQQTTTRLQSVVSTTHNPPTDPDPDADLRAQLNKLKEVDSEKTDVIGPSSNTEEDIAERFKGLTGRLPQSMQKSDILTPKPKMTDAEQVSFLMEQAAEEAKLDSKNEHGGEVVNNVNDLEKRLWSLQGVDPDKMKQNTAGVNDSSDDEYEAAAKVLRKALQEDAIDQKVKASGYGDLIEEDKGETIAAGVTLPGIPKHDPGTKVKPVIFQRNVSVEEELPWCCICNADAKLRCNGCDGDLYCRRCFKECHRGEDMEEHTTTPFREKNK